MWDDRSCLVLMSRGPCRCHYTDQDLDGLNLLFLNEDEDEMSVMPKAAWEMFGCFTKVRVASAMARQRCFVQARLSSLGFDTI